MYFATELDAPPEHIRVTITKKTCGGTTGVDCPAGVGRRQLQEAKEYFEVTVSIVAETNGKALEYATKIETDVVEGKELNGGVQVIRVNKPSVAKELYGFPPPPASPVAPAHTTEGDTQTKEPAANTKDEKFLLLLLLLLIPIFCVVYVLTNYKGNECKYLSWRFSHTNPYVFFGYMPKERRDALWREIKAGKQPQTSIKSESQAATEKMDKEDLKARAAGPSQAPAESI